MRDVGRALLLHADLAEAGVEVRLDAHPATGRTVATLHDARGALRPLSVALLADVDGLRHAVLGAVDDRPG